MGLKALNRGFCPKERKAERHPSITSNGSSATASNGSTENLRVLVCLGIEMREGLCIRMQAGRPFHSNMQWRRQQHTLSVCDNKSLFCPHKASYHPFPYPLPDLTPSHYPHVCDYLCMCPLSCPCCYVRLVNIHIYIYICTHKCLSAPTCTNT